MANPSSNHIAAQPITPSTTSINLFTLARMLSASATSSPLPQPQTHVEEERNVLAVARVGGMGGRVWSYAEAPRVPVGGAVVPQHQDGDAGGGGSRWWF